MACGTIFGTLIIQLTNGQQVTTGDYIKFHCDGMTFGKIKEILPTTRVLMIDVGREIISLTDEQLLQGEAVRVSDVELLWELNRSR